MDHIGATHIFNITGGNTIDGKKCFEEFGLEPHMVTFASTHLKNDFEKIEERRGVKIEIVKERSCFTVIGNFLNVWKAATEIQNLFDKCIRAKEKIEFPGIKHNFKKMKESIARVENKCKCTIQLEQTQDEIIDETENSLRLKDYNVAGEGYDNARKEGSLLGELQFSNTSLMKENQFGINVRIKIGRIANEKVDVIVNITSNDLQLRGGAVSASILLRAGLGFQLNLLEKYPNGIRSGELAESDGTNLSSSLVLHVALEKWDGAASAQCLHMLRETVRKCLEVSDNKQFASIAFPALGTGTLGFPRTYVAREMLDVIKDFSKKSVFLKSVTLIIFQTDILAMQAFKEELDKCRSSRKSSMNLKKFFGRWRKRSAKNNVVVSVKESEQFLNIGQVKVTLVMGELSKQRVNVIVKTVPTTLSLLGGGEMAISTDKQLQCVDVYYCALQNWDEKNAKQSEQALRSTIEKCLKEANGSGYSSIAFPAIGTEQLGFPCSVVTSVMFTTLLQFQAKRLKEIRFVVLPKNEPTVQVNVDPTRETKQMFLSENCRPGFMYCILLRLIAAVFVAFNDEFQKWTTYITNVGSGQTSLLMNIPEHAEDARSSVIWRGCYTIGNMRIIVKQGDITKENTDAIVNSSNAELDLSRGAVSNAIAKAGGLSLDAELVKLKPNMKKGGIVVSTACGLKCKYIIHVAAIERSETNYSHKWKTAIVKGFQEAEKLPIRSISIPALGTGGITITATESADIIFDAILEYNKGNVFHNIIEIRIIIYQPDMLGEYHRAANMAEESVKAEQIEMTRNDVDSITLLIIAKPSSNLSEIKRKLDKRFEEKQMMKYIENVKKDQIEDIKQIALRHFVKLEYETKNEKLRITGFVESVLSASEEVVQTARNKEQFRAIAELVKNPVKWYYEKNHEFIEFGDIENIKIESARINNEQKLKLSIDQQTWVLDFEKKILINENNQGEKYHVRRKQLSRVDLLQTPVNWKSMSGKQNLVVVHLDQASKEYTDVLDTFAKSVTTVQGKRFLIVKIERIQNRTLRTQYYAKREELETKNPKTKNENMLWHGTAEDAVDSINKTGFNRSYCGKNATAYGRGVYFAVSASYSADDVYSPPDSAGIKRIYHCRVLTGNYMKGTAGLKAPTIGSVLYDSAVDDINNPSMYVIFNDTQAYPEYMLYFKEI